jgi:uncharacterized protein YceK
MTTQNKAKKSQAHTPLTRNKVKFFTHPLTQKTLPFTILLDLPQSFMDHLFLSLTLFTLISLSSFSGNLPVNFMNPFSFFIFQFLN